MNGTSDFSLPAFERFWLGNALTFGASFTSATRAVRAIESTGRELINIAEHAGSEDAFHVTTVPRMVGIGRNRSAWSVVMVIEHLTRFNSDVTKIMSSLQQDITPRGKIEMHDYLPDPNATWETVVDFQNGINELSWTISGDTPARNAMFSHPWFGRLTAHQWLCCAALYQYLHLRHARRIVAILGVT